MAIFGQSKKQNRIDLATIDSAMHILELTNDHLIEDVSTYSTGELRRLGNILVKSQNVYPYARTVFLRLGYTDNRSVKEREQLLSLFKRAMRVIAGHMSLGQQRYRRESSKPLVDATLEIVDEKNFSKKVNRKHSQVAEACKIVLDFNRRFRVMTAQNELEVQVAMPKKPRLGAKRRLGPKL